MRKKHLVSIKYSQLILCFFIDVLEYGHLVHKKKDEKALEDCFRFYFKDTTDTCRSPLLRKDNS